MAVYKLVFNFLTFNFITVIASNCCCFKCFIVFECSESTQSSILLQGSSREFFLWRSGLIVFLKLEFPAAEMTQAAVKTIAADNTIARTVSELLMYLLINFVLLL